MKISKRNILALIGAVISITIISGCSNPISKEEPVPRTETPAKEVEIFTVGHGETVSFSKSGEISSASKAIVMPETTGRVTKIPVKLGDKVVKGQTLIALGNSLASDVTTISYETALKGIEKLNDSLIKMDSGAQTDIRSAILGYYTAKEALKTAIKNRDSGEDLYDEQADSLDDNIDSLKDALNTMEEQTPEYESNSTYQETLATYEQLKSQQDQAEIGNEISTNQTDFGIDSARRQLEGAILGVESLQNKYSLQFIQVESSLLQAQNGADIARLQKEALNIKSPITGTVTSIDATLNNLATPGQIVAIVENLDSMEVSTSVNSEELPLVKIGDKVSLSNGKSENIEGEISGVSPSLSSSNKKVEVKITVSSSSVSSSSNFLSGELITVTFKPQTTSIFVPLKAVSIEDDKYFVKLVSTDRTVAKQEITAGRILGTFIEVTSGLKKGDIIAFSSSTFIQESDKVTYKVPRI